MMTGLSMAAERENHACVSQSYSAEHTTCANLLPAQGDGGREVIGLPIKTLPSPLIQMNFLSILRSWRATYTWWKERGSL